MNIIFSKKVVKNIEVTTDNIICWEKRYFQKEWEYILKGKYNMKERKGKITNINYLKLKKQEKPKNYLTKRDVSKIFGLDNEAVKFIFDSPRFPKKIVNVNGRDAPVVEANDCMAYFRTMS